VKAPAVLAPRFRTARGYWGKSTFSTERGYHGRQKNPMIKIDARRAVENVRLWHDYCSGLVECLLSGVKQTLFPQPKMCASDP
jgi:hypothetical protein